MTNFCGKTADLMRAIGYAIQVLKIAAPVMIVLFATFDLGKAVMAGEDKEIQAAQKMLINRLVLGIVIFFVVTAVQIVINFVAGDIYGSEEIDDASKCWKCVVAPGSDECALYSSEVSRFRKQRTNNQWDQDHDGPSSDTKSDYTYSACLLDGFTVSESTCSTNLMGTVEPKEGSSALRYCCSIHKDQTFDYTARVCTNAGFEIWDIKCDYGYKGTVQPKEGSTELRYCCEKDILSCGSLGEAQVLCCTGDNLNCSFYSGTTCTNSDKPFKKSIDDYNKEYKLWNGVSDKLQCLPNYKRDSSDPAVCRCNE